MSCHSLWPSLSIPLLLALCSSAYAQSAENDPALYLIDSVTVTIKCEPADWCIPPVEEFRLPKYYDVKPRMELILRAYPPSAHDVPVVVLLVDSAAVSKIQLWKGLMNTDTTIDPDWKEKRKLITSGRFVVKAIVDPPGTPTANTYEVVLTKSQ